MASPGQRIGLVDENGVGKSSLLRLLAGIETADSGSLLRPPDCGFLQQEFPFPPQTSLQEATDSALSTFRTVKARLEELAEQLQHPLNPPSLWSEYSALLTWAETHDLWDADRRAEIMLAGLGLADLGRIRRLESLSGGQRSRLGLASC